MEDQIGKAGMKDSGKAMRLARLVDADWIALSAFLVVSGAERKMGERWAMAARRVGGIVREERLELLSNAVRYAVNDTSKNMN